MNERHPRVARVARVARVTRAALIACATLLLAAAPPTRAAAYCRLSVNTRSNGMCVEEPGVQLLTWTRSCMSYAFSRQALDRLTSLDEAEVRLAFRDSFDAWREVDCGQDPFAVFQDERVTQTTAAEVVWDLENESIVAVRTEREWLDIGYDPFAVAQTTIFHHPDTGEIYDIDIELNAGAGDFTECDGTCAPGEIDLRNTMTHEAGHYLGLGHSTVEGGTMARYGSKSETEKRTLEEDDRDGYCALELPQHQGSTCAVPIYSGTVSRADSGAGCSVTQVRPARLSLCAAACCAALALLARKRRAPAA